MIRRVIQWALLGIWLAAWWGCLTWFFTYGGYLTVHQISFFVAGLGLGLAARRLLLGNSERLDRSVGPDASNGNASATSQGSVLETGR